MVDNKLWMLKDFDKERCRHEINGITAVLHCHHFASLTTQLAIDCKLVEATKLLADCAEDTFYQVLVNYYDQHGIFSVADRIDIAQKYFAHVGLGKLVVDYAGPYSGKVTTVHSHVDEGWVKKWGTAEKPVNFIGCGYVTALFSAVFDKNERAYSAKEEKSIVCGDEVSVFRVIENTGVGGGANGN